MTDLREPPFIDSLTDDDGTWALSWLEWLRDTQVSINDKLALDDELEAIAGLTSAADTLPYFTGSGTADLADFTAAGRAILDDANAAAQLNTLGFTATAAEINTPLDGASVTLTEFRELETIGATTISAAQWGYLGNLDQDLITTSAVKFDNIYAGGRPWFDVRHYGAVGDNSNDDTTAIQATIDAAETTGGTVFFPYGDYKITSELQILTDEAVILQGVSWDGGSKIIGQFAGNLIRFDKGTNFNYRGGMQDLHIDGVSKTSGRHGVEFGMCMSPFVNRCFFENIDRAIVVGEGGDQYTQRMSISNIDFDYVEIGIYLQSEFNTSIWNIKGEETSNRGGTALINTDPRGTLAYTSGGVAEVVVGDTIVGATSTATAVVTAITLGSGTWAGGDAVGTITLNQQTTAAFQSENLNVGGKQANIATISGQSVSYDYYDSLFVDGALSATNRTYGIRLNVTTGTAGVRGRNHIGTFNNIICEVSTSKGLYVDGRASHGRCRVYNWYGDAIDIHNCPDLTLIGVQSHAANNITNCDDRKVIGCHLGGAGDLFDIERLGVTVFSGDVTGSAGADIYGGNIKLGYTGTADVLDVTGDSTYIKARNAGNIVFETPSGTEVAQLNSGGDFRTTGYLKLKITDVDGDTEGEIWYDASEDKLKFKTAAGVETITSV